MNKVSLLASVFAIATQLHAATVVTVNWAAATDNGIGLADGTPLAIGNEVRLGVFDFNPATLSSDISSFVTAGNLTGLATHFTMFDTSNIGNANSGSDFSNGVPNVNNRIGFFEKSSGAINVVDNSPLFGKQLFYWAFKTTANNAVLANFTNVTQTGIFSNSGNSAWTFPSDSGTSASTSNDITNLSNAAGNATPGSIGTATIPAGSFGAVKAGTGPGGSNTLASGNGFLFKLTVVPEPGSISLALAGGLAVFAGRRHRR